MNNSLFANANFDEGWEIKTTITLWGKVFEIIVRANAYYEEDGITPEQEESCRQFIEKKAENQEIIESLLAQYFADLENAQICERLSPETFVIWANGNCALLIYDAEDSDNGLAVALSPEKEVLTQDEYLSDNF
jgi:hypothetical protein